MFRSFKVYIMASKTATLYVGMTNNIKRRVWQHKSGETPGFSSRYGTNRLVYCEVIRDANSAINREKQIKSWRREKKVALIESMNPTWQDLSDGWYDGMIP